MPRTVQELLPTNDSFEVSGLAIKALAKCPSVKKRIHKTNKQVERSGHECHDRSDWADSRCYLSLCI